MIEDENAVKPEGWLDDEPELIPDSTAEKPSDWSLATSSFIVDNFLTTFNLLNYCNKSQKG